MKKKHLKKRISELESLVEQQQLLIQQLQLQINNQFSTPPYNQDLCWDGKQHEYPSPWNSTSPPHCKKCGKQAPDYNIYISSDQGTGITITDGSTTSDGSISYKNDIPYTLTYNSIGEA